MLYCAPVNLTFQSLYVKYASITDKIVFIYYNTHSGGLNNFLTKKWEYNIQPVMIIR
jgi:hypothetical protein